MDSPQEFSQLEGAALTPSNPSRNLSSDNQPTRTRSGALRPPAKVLFRRPGMQAHPEGANPQSGPLTPNTSPLQPEQDVAAPQSAPLPNPVASFPPMIERRPMRLPSQPVSPKSYQQYDTPPVSQPAPHNPIYMAAPQPAANPPLQPVQTVQLSPAGGSGRRAQFVEQRNHKNKKLARTIIFTTLTICILLALSLGGYLLLQNPGQTDNQSTQANPTAVPTLPALTATDPQTLYQQATKRKMLLEDTLTTQSPYNWQAINTDGECSFKDQQLHLSSIQGDKAIICLEQGLTFDNIAFQAQMTLNQGDTGGLLIRANPDGNTLYMFGLTNVGRFLLASAQAKTGAQTHIITGGLSSAIQQKTNQLTIIARQHTFYLYVNGQFLTKADDTTTKSGQIGFFAGDSEQNIPDATFSNARVWGV
ncbi:hypothetical protein [Dictyobacter alpinus]|nr:hypothetical protein [Dictyobacter alpinus]